METILNEVKADPGAFTVNLDHEIRELTDIKSPSKDQKDATQQPTPDPNGGGARLGTQQPITKERQLLPSQETSVADLAVQLIDMIQQWGCKYAYDHTALTAEQRQHLKEFWFEIEARENLKLEKQKPTPYEKWLMRKKVEQENYEKVAVEMSDSERNKLKLAFEAVFTESNIKVSPWMALVAALLTILIPRMIPVIGNLLDSENVPEAKFSSEGISTKAAA